ncbi:hypothetical protein FisN_9Hh090 [Fistulifera solaris]|jgi:hypothetical protein|uniref:Uncharacterized protein n=1 Tax=Fistulifera solaris TaxID=1519565 RepID=A0A1Z5K272_FISSO|nr:hypothetical protein FisN_9Hh090 [Fistulifera solaris]|eukprot:GAX20377.1 hypothetical protein FisN_9Hh090 [Fistulifera solaris]
MILYRLDLAALIAFTLLNASFSSSIMSCSAKIVVATRLHLGNALTAPTDLATKIAAFHNICQTSCAVGIIAVDATPKIANYNLVDAVSQMCAEVDERIHVLPVTPWGEFVSALNALVIYARKRLQADRILFLSAETVVDRDGIQELLAHLTPDTLVVGARLPGHVVRGECVTLLSGTTSPWNTLAVWDLHKLSLTGFQLVSDGLLTDDKEEPSFGVEEVVAIALLQKLLGTENAKAKLVTLKHVDWQVDSFDDPERRKWQEEKMKSKEIRAQRQLDLIGLAGKVHHL